jgi:hypothetical protein
MQVSNEQVVAALAEVGIGVTGELVSQVKVELLKETARGGRQRVMPPDRPERLRRPPKVPPRRGDRS